MKVCVTGCYYWPEVYKVLNHYAGVNRRRHDICVITHTDEPPTEYTNLRMVRGPDYGLDAGKYDFYLRNIWDGKEGVFFMHDDVFLSRPENDPFDFIKSRIKGRDIAFFFGNGYQAKKRNGRNFRTMYLGGRYLKAMLKNTCKCKEREDHYNGIVKQMVPGLGPHNGFLYDPNNLGITDDEKAVPGMRDVNMACRHFLTTQWKSLHERQEWKWGTVVDDFMSFAIRGGKMRRKERNHISRLPKWLTTDQKSEIMKSLYRTKKER